MRLRRKTLLAASPLALLLLLPAVAFAAKSYPDRVGDVRGGAAPDVASVTLSNTRTRVTFVIRFAEAPPLGFNRSENWVDMLMVGVDVPPLGRRPVSGYGWSGANLWFATHGPSKTGQILKVPDSSGTRPRTMGTFKIATNGSTLRFSIPLGLLGNARWFRFLVAVGRESEVEQGSGYDLSPDRGTFRYAVTG